MAGSPSREALIRQLAQKYSLDPSAVVAIASVEGQRALHGGTSIGDNGTSFGPFQLHAGGALPANVWARGAAFANKWANSPQGITYAESRMAASGAAGLQGRAAVQTISSKFERPADVPGEVSKAMGFYGGQSSGGRTLDAGPPVGGGGSAQGPLAGPNTKMAMVTALLSQASAAANGQPMDPNSLMQIVTLRQQAQAAQQQYGSGAAGPLVAPKAGRAGIGGSVKFVGNITGENQHFVTALSSAAQAVGGTQIRVSSGYRSPSHNAAVGGVPRSNHMTGTAMDGEIYIPGRGWVPLGTALKGVAPQFGLRSGDQSGFYHGGTDPVHVDSGLNQRG